MTTMHLKRKCFSRTDNVKTIPDHMDHTDVHVHMLSQIYIFVVYTETVTVSFSKTGTVKSVSKV